MSLLHHDNFNHYAYAQAASSGEVTSIVASTGSLSFTANGRDSLKALTVAGGTSCFDTYWRKTLAPGNAYHYQGVRVRLDALPSYVGGMLSVLSTGTGQITLAVQSDGTLAVTKGSINDYLFTSGAVLGATTFALSTGVRYFVELYVYVHSTLGVVQVRVNGTTRLTLTNVNTNLAASGSWNGAVLGNFGAGGNPFIRNDSTMHFNDWYVLDGVAQAGPNAFNTFLGDCKTEVVLPTIAGAHADATLSTGTDHVAVVDDTTPNDDTDYAELAAIGDRESWQYALPTPAGGGGILAVTLAAWAKKTDTGTRSLVESVRKGGTDYDGSTDHPLSTGYVFERFTRTADPATSAEFAPGSTLEMGVKVSA